MAIRRSKPGIDDGQLDLFSNYGNHVDTIRNDGGETLARVPAQDGGTIGSQGDSGGNTSGSRTQHQKRDVRPDHEVHEGRINGATGPRPSLGNGQGRIHFSAAGGTARLEPRNRANYRIADKDEVGKGSPRKKCWNNIEAIRLLRQLDSEKRNATDSEKSILVRYVGWGGLPQVFNPASDWQNEAKELTALLSKQEFKLARASTLNAHYTSGEVVSAMYSALDRLGFKGGRILEPACGIGHFIGYMPETIQSRSLITGIEIDPVSAKIAKILYPDADIRNEAFEKARLADEFFDVVISNIPFGDYKPYDSKFNKHGFLIHDYFFAAAIEKIRPGGIIMFITSMGTMDKNSSKLRKYLGEKADLVGAIRLPNTAFKQNANTEVTTDIIILRKRRLREAAKKVKWEKVVPYTSAKGVVIPINEYYFNNQHMMLGEMSLAGRMYARHEPTLESNGKEIKATLAEVIKKLPPNIYEAINQPLEISTQQQSILAPGHIKPNAYTIHDDDIAVRQGDKLVPLPHLPVQTKLRIRGMIRIRDAVRECLRTQLEDAPEDEIQLARTLLNGTYDRFISRYGPVSDRVNGSAFQGDPDLPLLFSLENYDSEKKAATKTAIFRERTIQRQKPMVSANTAKEALLFCLNEKGRVDLKHIEKLLHRPTDELLPELKGILFLNPQTQAWETEDQYLSGDVREKLKTAEAAAIADPRFIENVEALKSAQPEDLSATQIDARLGACWIPVKDFEAFAQELLGAKDIEVYFTPQLGVWTVQGGYTTQQSVANTTEWGTRRAPALELIEDALNVRTPTIYDWIKDGKKKRQVVNAEQTEAARDKHQKIKDRFRAWIWQDDERRQRLVKKYNEEFNAVRLRIFNGEHLTLPGASGAIQLQPQQKNGIWRILQTPNTLLAHVVGAGKTYTMVAAAMELKRLGLARKPLLTVPNHMLGQFSSEFLTLYPSANILAATKDDFEKSKRRELMSRIATGNWDAIIVTHSGFEKIPLSKKTTEAFFEKQLDELEAAIREQKAKNNTRSIVKQLESAKKKLETRMKVLSADEKKDNTLTFEELGIDRLFVDEAHYFKNLFYISKMTRIAGLPQTASERAFDMFLLRNTLNKFFILSELKTEGSGRFLQIAEQSLAIFLFVILDSFLHIGFAVLKEPVNDARQFMRGGGDRRGGPEPAAHSPIKGPQRGLAVLQRQGRHSQGVGSAIKDMSRVTTEHLPATDAGVGAQSQPGGKMFFGGPTAHVGSDFAEDDLGRQYANALNGRQIHSRPAVQFGAQVFSRHPIMEGLATRLAGRQGLLAQAGQGGHLRNDLFIALQNLLIVNVIQFKGTFEDKEMLGAKVTLHGFGNGRLGGSHPPVGQSRQFLPITFSLENRFDNAQAADPGHIAQDLVQLYVHLLQRLLQVLALHAAGAHQVIPIAKITPQHAHRIGGPERPVEQAVAMQALDPLAIQNIGFAPGDIFDLPCIDQADLKAAAFQNLKGRNPVNAGRFHGHSFDPAVLEPIGHRLQVLGECAKTPHRVGTAACRHGAPMFPMANVNARRIRADHIQGFINFKLSILLRLSFSFHVTVAVAVGSSAQEWQRRKQSSKRDSPAGLTPAGLHQGMSRQSRNHAETRAHKHQGIAGHSLPKVNPLISPSARFYTSFFDNEHPWGVGAENAIDSGNQ